MPLENILKSHQHTFATIVPFSPQKDKLLLLDFSEKNTDITHDLLNDTTSYTHYINKQLAGAGARYGIGGYAEHRPLYNRSRVFDGVNEEDEPRRLHLGMDIWGKPNTAVISPLNGIVHSFAFNNSFGDYGATMILSHQLDGFVFHTLYGHLSMNSIRDLQAGQRVEAGDIIGELGIAIENGHWPPHLHFQLIIDLENREGDYPGVCKLSEKEKYLANCPDPDLILQINQYAGYVMSDQ